MQQTGILLTFVVFFLSGCIPAPSQPQNKQVEYKSLQQTTSPDSNQSLTQAELQYQIMSFADTYAQTVGTAAVQFEERLPTPKARLMAKRTKVYAISAAFDIAAGPSPEAALLDMAVLVTLNRIVWDEYWSKEVFGPAAEVLVAAYQNSENEIWTILAQILTEQQQDELREQINQWRADHPELTGVNFVRFNDFGKLRGTSLSTGSTSGGLLATVAEATRAVDDSLLLAERARFLLSRMQLLAGLQVELVYMELVTEPEMEKLQSDVGHFANLAEWVQNDFPATLTKERESALKQLREEISAEREKAISQLVAEIGNEREAAIKQMLAGVAKEREASISQFMQEFSEERKRTISQAVTSLAGERVSLEKQMIAAQNHGFKLILAFLVATLFGIVAATLLYRFLARKLFGANKEKKSQSIDTE